MQNVQRDFVLGVLSEEELGQQIHIHELHREYATCVQTLRTYDAVSRDILQVCCPRCQKHQRQMGLSCCLTWDALTNAVQERIAWLSTCPFPALESAGVEATLPFGIVQWSESCMAAAWQCLLFQAV